METKPTPMQAAAAFWNPMAPWIDLSLRALDMSMSVTQSWQQWMAGTGTLIAAQAEPPAAIETRGASKSKRPKRA